MGQFDLFRSLFNVLFDAVKIEPGYCYSWIFKSPGHDFIHIIATGSLNSQDMIKILKQSVHDFSGKRLCDGHCMKILCDVYVWRSIFNR